MEQKLISGGQCTQSGLRKPAGNAQVNQSNKLVSGITPMQIGRIVKALEDGYAERNIAESEAVPERMIRQIRRLHIDRLHRRMSAVGTVFGGMLENMRTIHGEIDRDAFDDLEGAA